MAELFRVFIGDWNDEEGPDWVLFDQVMPWVDAHAFMVAKYERWTHDTCPSCAQYATSQLPTLRAVVPGDEWEDMIEGDDYIITRAEQEDSK